MIDFTKPLQTRDGRKVEIISTCGRKPYPYIGYIGDVIAPFCWSSTGGSIEGVQHGSDLVNAPEKHVVYLNIGPRGVHGHPSREAANLHASATRTACVRIEYTDGQFDD